MQLQRVSDRDTNQTVNKYIKSIEISSQKTATEYRKRLNYFKDFVLKNYNLTLDEIIKTLTTYSHGPKIDVYDLLSGYVEYIHKERNVSPLTLKSLISTVRSYLETFDVEISPQSQV